MASSSRTFLALALVAMLVMAAAAQTAPAHSKNKGGKTSKCASTFEGCTKCKTVSGEYTCTKCRANSTFDDTSCVCNSDEGYGTLTKAQFDEWAADKCKGKKKHCKKPSYSSVKGKCVKCENYGCPTAESGVCLSAPISVTSGRRLFGNADAEELWA
jgi:hypothetical protein